MSMSLAFSALTASLPLLPGCGSGASGGSAAVDPPPPAPPEQAVQHPGLLHTAGELTVVGHKVAAKAQPWQGGWEQFLASRRVDLDVPAYPLEVVSRGGSNENYGVMVVDMTRAYLLALRWRITGDEAYAKDAVRFMNAWSSTLRSLEGDSNRFLASGLYGNQWANAGEVMRDYPGWAPADRERFQNMLLNVFYPHAHDFLTTHNGSEIRKVTHYWANWDLANICAVYAIGVFCDRRDLMDEAVNYYKSGRGNGASAHNVYFVHPGYLGQWQESHRDQGHSTLGIALAGMLCEMAWNQGEDLFGHWNNRLLAGAEYVAKTNLSGPDGQPYEMPFTPYTGVHGTGTAAAGTGSLRPCFELIYNHYVKRKGLSAPWTQAMVEKIRPERGDGGDSLGFGTLFYTREGVAPARPSGLSAFLSGGGVRLSWWGSAGATHYLVQRGSGAAGPFTTLSQVTEPRTYLDTPPAGAWHYRIVAVTAGGELVGDQTARVAVPGELWLHLPLDGSADDKSAFGRHGQVAGGATWGDGRNGGKALYFDGRDGHLVLPEGALAALGDFSVAVWVYVDGTARNTRIFDFGSDDVAYVALTPNSGDMRLNFMASREQFWPPQPLSAAALATGRWSHVAVTVSGTVGTLYVDGAQVATSQEIWMNPFQMGRTTRTWLGRSQYGGDAYFKGRMQDFRVYAGALTPANVAELAR